MSEQLLPHDIDAEKNLLGAFFRSPTDVGTVCVAEEISEASFYLPAHSIIFRHQMAAWVAGTSGDFFLIQSAIKNAGELVDAGGPHYLTEVSGCMPSPSMAAEFAAIVRNKYSLRRIILEASRATKMAYASSDAPATIAEVQESFLAITARRKDRRKTFKQHLSAAVERISSGQNASSDIQTGITALDKVVRMRKGNTVVICGATKSGKTALLGNIITHAAVRQQKRVVLFSLEMSDEEQVDRFLSSEGKVAVSTMSAYPLEHELQRLMRAVGQLTNADITLVSDAGSWVEILSTARQMHAQKPIDLICLDYFQLAESAGDTREQQVAAVSRGFKSLCAQLGVVGIGLSQLNDQGKMRESRAIAQDANCVLSVEVEEDGGRGIRVALQRSGAMGMVIPVQWYPHWTKFEDA